MTKSNQRLNQEMKDSDDYQVEKNDENGKEIETIEKVLHCFNTLTPDLRRL